MLAGREQLAERLLEDGEVVHLPAGEGGQRLVEEAHALVDVVAVDEAGPEVGQGGHLQSEIGGRTSLGQGLPELVVLRCPVRLEQGAVERHPASLRAVPGALQQRLGSGQPARGHREVTSDRVVHPRQGAGHPDGPELVSLRPVGRVGALPAGDRAGEVEVQVVGAGQHLEDIPRRLPLREGLDETAGGGGVPGPQRGASLLDPVPVALSHSRIFAPSDRRRPLRPQASRSISGAPDLGSTQW